MTSSSEPGFSDTGFHTTPEGQALTQNPAFRFGSNLSACVEGVLNGVASAGLLSGLQQMGQAAAILNQNGLVIGMNARARDQIGRSVSIRAGRLWATSEDGDNRFQLFVRGLLGSKRPVESTASIVLPSGDGASVLVRGTRISSSTTDVFPHVTGLLTFTDSRSAAMPSNALLRSMFGLTACEAGIALAIADGDDPQTIATKKNISIGTVRHHLKSIFGKTNTRRQASLAVLITKLHTTSMQSDEPWRADEGDHGGAGRRSWSTTQSAHPSSGNTSRSPARRRLQLVDCGTR